jgi:2-alkenal reductase
VAIGNPFQFGGSMMIGIVSAVGRTIPSGLTPFSIPQAIQTDAAINPGNSGGPLLNLVGEVIGVNAQIARDDTGVRANAGVGFAIPSNVVQLVVPSLIAKGSYEWPWLGVQGTDVNLTIMKANQLDSQWGAYISNVLENGPAADAGLRGSSREVTVDGVSTPVGGDIIVAADGSPITDFNDLLVEVVFKKPGDTLTLTILRDGRRQEVLVKLEARPSSF